MAGRSSGQGRGHQHLQGLSQHFLCGAAPLCAAAEVPPHIRRSEKKEGTEVMEQEVLIRVSHSAPYKPPPFKCSFMVEWRRRSTDDLSNLPLPTLKQLKKELEIIVQEASGELVGLLQKRQGLQEEVDIRSITIEQLLKFAERRQLQLGEPLAIQMSVVRNHCQEASSENGLG
ncbi:uncharacterized protein LOC121868272 [Homarus americanus]|uniref:uncharacterized protein LOC121868272 n=1 Tax=Homarus americanus TaxID=6706 RepID=UPI001C443C41|nr:uncharacterized protein LOC121868272 [Homarus americanus]